MLGNSFDSNVNILESWLTTAEKTLNVPGYIPLVSNVSAVFRYKMGIIQVVSGLALAAFLAIEAQGRNSMEKQVQYERAEQMLTFAGHGAANCGRATVESMPFIGNIATFLYDKVQRLSYPSEGGISFGRNFQKVGT